MGRSTNAANATRAFSPPESEPMLRSTAAEPRDPESAQDGSRALALDGFVDASGDVQHVRQRVDVRG